MTTRLFSSEQNGQKNTKTPNLTHNKIPDNKSHRVFYGASDGTRDKPDFAKLAQLCLEEIEIMTRLEKWFK